MVVVIGRAGVGFVRQQLWEFADPYWNPAYPEC